MSHDSAIASNFDSAGEDLDVMCIWIFYVNHFMERHKHNGGGKFYAHVCVLFDDTVSYQHCAS